MGSTVSTIWLAPSRLVEMRPQEVMPEHASVDIRRHASNSRPRVLALVQPRHPDARAHPHYNSASPRAAPRHPHTARRATNQLTHLDQSGGLASLHAHTTRSRLPQTRRLL